MAAIWIPIEIYTVAQPNINGTKMKLSWVLSFETVRETIVIRYQNIVHFWLGVDDAQNRAIALP